MKIIKKCMLIYTLSVFMTLNVYSQHFVRTYYDTLEWSRAFLTKNLDSKVLISEMGYIPNQSNTEDIILGEIDVENGNLEKKVIHLGDKWSPLINSFEIQDSQIFYGAVDKYLQNDTLQW